MIIRCPGCGKEKNIGEGKYKCKSCKIKFQLKNNSLIVKNLSEHNAYIDSIISETEEKHSFNKTLSVWGAILFLICYFILVLLTTLNIEVSLVFILILSILGALMPIGTLVINLATWRCPACGKYLSHGRSLLIYPLKCGSCGITIKRG